MTSHTALRELADPNTEFARLVARGMAEARVTEQWLSGTAGIKLTPFALDGLAHSFGLMLDKHDAALAKITALREVRDSERAEANLWHKTAQDNLTEIERLRAALSKISDINERSETIGAGDFYAIRDALNKARPNEWGKAIEAAAQMALDEAEAQALSHKEAIELIDPARRLGKRIAAAIRTLTKGQQT